LKNDETTVRVRYKDTDQMGVAYHSNYLVWFEIGRTELMRNIGIPYLEFEKNSLYLPVLKAYCEYKHAARYDEELTVSTRLESLQHVRLKFAYELYREGKLLARGYTEHAFTSHTGQPVALKKFCPSLWARLCSALENRKEKSGENK
jgi:acyl-CoA thioester hydrolase